MLFLRSLDSDADCFAVAQQYVNISIGAQLLSALLPFKLQLKGTFKYLACYGNIYAAVNAENPWEMAFFCSCMHEEKLS